MSDAEPRITTQRIKILVDHHDPDGVLVFANDKLAALFVRLDGVEHGDDRGKWYLELGFSGCAAREGPVLSSMKELLAWVGDRVAAVRPPDTLDPANR